MRRSPLAIKLMMICLLLLASGLLSSLYASQLVVVAELSDNIHSVTAGFVSRAIDIAEKEGASLFILRLNTPGGLDQAMRDIILKIINAKVPVVVFVAPSGARAASAGFFILISADVAVMAPGTNTGAAHPVSALPFVKIDKKMEAKIVNDAVAYIKGIAEKRGRPLSLVEKAVRKSASFSANEALSSHLIDLIANNEGELLKKLNGRRIKKFNGEEVVLHLGNPRLEVIRMDARERLLSTISQPFITFILLAIGVLGIYFELVHPGFVFPGVVGAICLILAFFAFQIIPVNYAGVLLIILALIFFILEVKVVSYGMLTVAGIISMILGSLMLIKAPIPEMRIPLSLIIPVALAVAFIVTFLLRLVIRAHRKPVATGAEGLQGEIGEAKTDISPEGTVFIHGEIWRAYSGKRIKKGEKVRVIGMRGLVLSVEPIDEGSRED
ncbi:MAG: nodulation protein NfeD [Acidobacteria bacterium]|nr:nodulation protein NfeD [Acidobacteriota bacterium]